MIYPLPSFKMEQDLNEKVGFGTVDTILEVVKENELSNPAIIVLGEVVKHRAILENVQHEYLKEAVCIIFL